MRSREEGHHGLAERALSLTEAQRRDRRIIRRRRLIWGIGIAIVLAIAAVVILNAIDFETERNRERLRRRIATTDQHIAQMQAWPTDAGHATERFAADMAAYTKARDAVGVACGIDSFVGRNSALAHGSGAPEACILAAQAARPWMAIESVRLTPKDYWLHIRLPKIIDRRPTLATVPRPNTVSTEDGRTLRAQLTAKLKTAQALWQAHAATSQRLGRARFAGSHRFAPLIRALRQDTDLRNFSVFWSAADFVTVRSPRLERWLTTMVNEKTPFAVPDWQMSVGVDANDRPVNLTFRPSQRP